MKRLLSIFILLLLFACGNTNYKTIDFASFEITVPKNWNKYEIVGIDSYVGGLITESKDTLIFDLGWYSPDLTNNPELLVFEESEFSKFTDEQKERLKGTKHLVVADLFSANFEPKEYLKYEFELDSVDCFKAKFIKPKNKGFGASGIYIDSLKGGENNSSRTKLSFYGKDLSDSTQAEFCEALKTLRLKEYCK